MRRIHAEMFSSRKVSA